MLFILPVLVLVLAALAITVMRRFKRSARYSWLAALLASFLAIAGVSIWYIRMPVFFSLPSWRPVEFFNFTPTWIADGISLPYAFAICVLVTAVILTSVVRKGTDKAPWAGTLLLAALGILSVSAANPLTLILIWTALDLAELAIMLRSTRGERQSQEVIIAFAGRVVGTGFVIWAGAISASSLSWQGFDHFAGDASIYLLIASGLRLGVLPLHLPYRSDSVIRRGFGTSLRLISAAASLALLARIPARGVPSPWSVILLLAAIIPALYAGWMWLRASDEIVGRPFWVLGMAALALASALRGSPYGSIGWGLALILSGGMAFLYSSRQRTMLWLPLIGLWALSSLPFSPSAMAWFSDGGPPIWFILPILPAQALMAAGFFRHLLHPGETSFESQERWSRVLYPAGLIILVVASLVLGVWGWPGALQMGLWWLAIPAILLAMAIVVLSQRWFRPTSTLVSQWGDILRTDIILRFFGFFVRILARVAGLITRTLEGEGGIFWSILLLVLLLSLISMRGGG